VGHVAAAQVEQPGHLVCGEGRRVHRPGSTVDKRCARAVSASLGRSSNSRKAAADHRPAGRRKRLRIATGGRGGSCGEPAGANRAKEHGGSSGRSWSVVLSTAAATCSCAAGREKCSAPHDLSAPSMVTSRAPAPSDASSRRSAASLSATLCPAHSMAWTLRGACRNGAPRGGEGGGGGGQVGRGGMMQRAGSTIGEQLCPAQAQRCRGQAGRCCHRYHPTKPARAQLRMHHVGVPTAASYLRRRGAVGPHGVDRVGLQRHQLLASRRQLPAQLLRSFDGVHRGVDAHPGASWQVRRQPLVHLRQTHGKNARAEWGRGSCAQAMGQLMAPPAVSWRAQLPAGPCGSLKQRGVPATAATRTSGQPGEPWRIRVQPWPSCASA
jgi:hypothetical protein